MEFSVSVIIPVYNGEAFIEKAIKSVLIQSEVAEIIVVNDGSADESLQLIKKIQEEDNRIKIFHHNRNINKGRAASRNLAIKKATQPFIAFLDADDYYLENRFLKDKEVFNSNSAIDGVYNAIGASFYKKVTKKEEEELKLTTVTEKIRYTELFNYLLNGKKGYFSIDGLTVKRTVFKFVGFFNEKLEVAEDTDLILKMAVKCKLEAGIIDKPLAMRGVHDENVFNQTNLYIKHRSNMYASVIRWGISEKISNKNIDDLLKWLWYYRNKDNNNLILDLNYWFYLIRKNPSLLSSKLGYKYFPIIRQRKKLFPILFR